MMCPFVYKKGICWYMMKAATGKKPVFKMICTRQLAIPCPIPWWKLLLLKTGFWKWYAVKKKNLLLYDESCCS